MKLSQLLLPFGCAWVGVCLLLAANGSGQDTGGIPNRVTHAPDDGVRVKLAGNVHPLARAIASGDVALLATLADGSTLGLDQFTLSNGAVTSAKTQGLPGGMYHVYAHYAGDGTNERR
jgi:hypothetical protein